MTRSALAAVILGVLAAASAAVLVIAVADHGSAAGAQFEQVPPPAQEDGAPAPAAEQGVAEEGGRAGGVLGGGESPTGANASGGPDAEQSIRADGETVSVTGELLIPALALGLLLAGGVVALRRQPTG